MIRIVVVLAGGWVLKHRDDDLLPIDFLKKEIQAKYGDSIIINDASLTELDLKLGEDILDGELCANEIKNIFSEHYGLDQENDILSIKYNLVGDTGRDIFVSVGGSSYKGCIRHFITNMGLYNLEVHIYRDNDQSMSQMYEIAELLRYFNISTFVHNNTYPNEKDYGVPKDRIIDNIIQI